MTGESAACTVRYDSVHIRCSKTNVQLWPFWHKGTNSGEGHANTGTFSLSAILGNHPSLIHSRSFRS